MVGASGKVRAGTWGKLLVHRSPGKFFVPEDNWGFSEECKDLKQAQLISSKPGGCDGDCREISD